MEEEKRYVGEAETQHTQWKGTVALDEPPTGTFDDIDRERWGQVVAFSLFGGLGKLDSRATAYVVEPSQMPEASERTGGETLQAVADANDGEIPVVRLEYTKATVEYILRTFRQFHIVVQPAWLADSGQRLRIDRSINLGEEEEGEP